MPRTPVPRNDRQVKHGERLARKRAARAQRQIGGLEGGRWAHMHQPSLQVKGISVITRKEEEMGEDVAHLLSRRKEVEASRGLLLMGPDFQVKAARAMGDRRKSEGYGNGDGEACGKWRTQNHTP